MRVHGARGLEAHAWADSPEKNLSPERVQLRFGVTRYSVTVEEARRLAAELIAAADEVESTEGVVGDG